MAEQCDQEGSAACMDSSCMDSSCMDSRTIGCRPLFSGILALLLVTAPASAGDWPQILGPQRNGIASGEQLLAAWGSQGPRMQWSAEVGQGFAGVAVVGNRVVTFYRDGREEIVQCLDAASGRSQWRTASPCSYSGGVSGDTGPRCVPVISGDVVITFGVEGRLQCLQLATGEKVWERDTTADFRPLEGYFGAGSTPVVAADRVIVNVGGREENSVVAFDLATGKTLWSAFSDNASYSAPVVTEYKGRQLALVITRLHLTGIDVASGGLQFAIPFGARGPTVNAATPLVTGDRVFISASYGIGSRLISLADPEAGSVQRDEMILATQYATPVAAADRGDLIFAVDGRQDAGSGQASLKCVDLATWKVLWEERGLDYGSLIRVNQELLMLTCGGELIRIAADSRGFRASERHQVQESTDRGYRLPAIANGRLFIRDDSKLRCLQVGVSSGG